MPHPYRVYLHTTHYPPTRYYMVIDLLWVYMYMLCVFCNKDVPLEQVGFQSPHAQQFGMCLDCRGSKHEEWQGVYTPPSTISGRLPGSPQSRKMARVRAFVDMVKSKSTCLDCSAKFDPVCLDFDHRPDTVKRREVSACKTIQQAADEIAKCDLICACCHRLRTKKRARAA